VTRQRGIPKFREVRYVDDGVTEYQCLSCKNTWDMRGMPAKFCMFCGIRWEGQLVWRDEVRDARDLLRGQAANRFAPSAVWVIEYRVTELPWETQWDAYGEPMRVTEFNAVKMWAIMKDTARWRENCEFRVVMRAAAAA